MHNIAELLFFRALLSRVQERVNALEAEALAAGPLDEARAEGRVTVARPPSSGARWSGEDEALFTAIVEQDPEAGQRLLSRFRHQVVKLSGKDTKAVSAQLAGSRDAVERERELPLLTAALEAVAEQQQRRMAERPLAVTVEPSDAVACLADEYLAHLVANAREDLGLAETLPRPRLEPVGTRAPVPVSAGAERLIDLG